MPLPPAIKNILFFFISFPFIVTIPPDLYPNFPNGPSTLIKSPIFNFYKYGVSFPPCGYYLSTFAR
jgi:hypothetical protein